MLGMMLGDLHRYDEAIAEEKAVIARSPKYTFARFQLAYLYLYSANYAEADKQARAAAAQVGEDPETISALVHAVAHPEERPNALKLVTEGKVGHYSLSAARDAFWFSMLGAHERALESLKQWVANSQEGELSSGSQVLWTPAFDPLRGDEGFKEVMKSVGSSTAPVHP
jgi:tetratricopeptide (TPR) repeat protein